MSAAHSEVDARSAEDIIKEREAIRASRKTREVAGRVVVTLKPAYRWQVNQLAEETDVPAARVCRELIYEALEARGYPGWKIAEAYREVENKARLEWHEKELARLKKEIED